MCGLNAFRDEDVSPRKIIDSLCHKLQDSLTDEEYTAVEIKEDSFIVENATNYNQYPHCKILKTSSTIKISLPIAKPEELLKPVMNSSYSIKEQNVYPKNDKIRIESYRSTISKVYLVDFMNHFLKD